MMMRTLKAATCAVAVVLPATITFLDNIGYVAAVDGISMQPLLNPGRSSTDYVLLNRWKARKMQFSRGEVVSLTSPVQPTQSLIKRIIALEGDTVRTLSYKNRVIEVPEGHCWVEGDNHGKSLDSNMFGPVSIGLITAKASHVVWPPSRFQRLRTLLPDPQRVESSYHKDIRNTHDSQSASDLTRISCKSEQTFSSD